MDPAASKAGKYEFKYLGEEDPSHLATGKVIVLAAIKMAERGLQFVNAQYA